MLGFAGKIVHGAKGNVLSQEKQSSIRESDFNARLCYRGGDMRPFYGRLAKMMVMDRSHSRDKAE